MSFTIPNLESSPSYDGQSVPDSTDWAITTGIDTGTGVLSGGGIVNIAGLTVSLASVSAQSAGTPVTGAAASVTLVTAGTYDRRDLIYLTSNGAASVATGTQCATTNWTRNTVASQLPPVKPSIPSGGIPLWEVYVPGGASSLTSNNLIDKRPALSNGSMVASIQDVSLANSTQWQTICSYTPQSSGLYSMQAFLDIPAGGASVGVQATFGDSIGSEVVQILPIQSMVAGPWSSLGAFVSAHSGTALNLQVYASCASVSASVTASGAIFQNTTTNVVGTTPIVKTTETTVGVLNTWHTIATYTPAAIDLFEVQAYLEVPTGGASVGVQTTYADAGGSETLVLYSPASVSAGPWSTQSAMFAAHNGTPINVQVNTSASITASARIEAF